MYSSSPLNNNNNNTSSSSSSSSPAAHVEFSTPNIKAKKFEDHRNGFLLIHGDLVIREGSLKLKSGFMNLSWRSEHFVFDGHCLYRVKRPTPTQVAALREQYRQQQQQMPQLTPIHNHKSSLTSTGGDTNSATSMMIADSIVNTRHLYKLDSSDIFVFVEEEPTSNSRGNTKNSHGSSQGSHSSKHGSSHSSSSSSSTSTSSTTTMNYARVIKVLNAECITNRKWSIGLFFDKNSGHSPLFLCAENEQDQAQWLDVLQRAVDKGHESHTSLTPTSSSTGTTNTSPSVASTASVSPSIYGSSPSSKHMNCTTHLGSLTEKSNRRNRDSPSLSSTKSVNNIHTAIEAMVDPALISNAFGDIQCVNQALSRLFGYTPTQMLNKNVKELMPGNYAKVHDRYMDRYRKTGEKHLIGVPRVVPILLSNGSTMQATLSLGEIPNSTNSDNDRFLAVMTPVHMSVTTTSMNHHHSGSYNNNRLSVNTEDTSTSDELTASSVDGSGGMMMTAGPTSPDMALSHANVLKRNSFMALGRHRSSSNSRHVISSILDTSDSLSQMSVKVNQLFDHLEEETRPMIERMEYLEKSNAKLIAVTSEQSIVTQHLRSECREFRYVPNPNSRRTFDDLLKRVKTDQQHLSDVDAQLFQIAEKDVVDLDLIMVTPLALKHFILYANMEQSTDNLKFYCYVKKQYVKERNLDMLAIKKDFIMQTFIAIGSQKELNLSSNERMSIEKMYDKSVKEVEEKRRAMEQAGGGSEEEIEELIHREQHFFDNLLVEMKGVLLDTFMRFRTHANYKNMKMEILEMLDIFLSVKMPQCK